MGIQSYTSVAASNTSLFPENMLSSAVNDNLRQVQADLKTWYSDSEWQRQEEAPSRASATTFKITGDVTTKYLVNRAIRVNDASTYVGIITASSYSAPDTTITVDLDSGSLTASLTAVAIGILSPTNRSLPTAIGRKGANVASASTINLSTCAGDFCDVTGTTTITAITSEVAGVERTIRFTGALTLTYNATSLILPGAANITTANGDTAIFRSLGSGNWQCISYQPASGRAIILNAINKNFIINGNMDVWQRGITAMTAGGYTADMWNFDTATGLSVQQYTLTPAEVETVGTGAHFALQFTSTSGNPYFRTRLEDVRNFSNQSYVFTFWAKAASTTTINNITFRQNFGSGGSPSANVDTTGSITTVNLTTSFQKFTVTITLPSISAKTIGTTTPGFLEIFLQTTSAVICYFTGAKLETGTIATAYEFLSYDTIQRMCRRYLRIYNQTLGQFPNIGFTSTTTLLQVPILFDAPMFVTPTITYTAVGTFQTGFRTGNISSIATSTSNQMGFVINVTVNLAYTAAAQADIFGILSSGQIICSAEL